MIIANFDPGSDYKRVSGLDQWDYGQQLRIQGLDLPVAVEIHFSLTDVGGEAITRIGTTADGVTDVIIPDSMLENGEEMGEQYSIFAYVYLSDTKSGKTMKKIEMIVSTRPKPQAWDRPEDEEIFREAIEAVNAAADRAEAAEGNAVQSAESARSDATKTAEDRKAVEELVLMTSDIEEQVDAVKQYKEQAATAATNAALSEQAAKTAKDAAIQAQTAAEIAEDAAEQHAIAAAGDKAEVERMAGQVATDKQTVAQDKADVEKKVSDFELTAQQAVADVNNAGQEQVERVQGAGDTAIQEVNAAKDTAVQEVNSAKDAAVQSVTTTGQEQITAVQEEGKKAIESIPEDYQTAMDSKVDKQQGAENAGKVLGIDAEGNIVPVEQKGGLEFGKISKLLIKPETAQAELLQITDSADFPVLELSGQGWTEQDSTTGAQLFYDKNVVLLVDANSPDEVVTDGNKTTFKRKIGTYNQFAIRIKIEPNKIGEYKVSVKNIQIKKTHSETFENGSFLQIYVYKNGSQIGVGNRNFLINVDDISAKYEVELRFVNKNNEFTSYDALIAELMIAEKTVTKYEEYTGNQPSPNPDYPQDIVSEGVRNPEAEKYERTLKVTGKNFFDIKKTTEILGANIATGELEGEKIKINTLTTGKGGYVIIKNPIKLLKGKTYSLSKKTLESSSGRNALLSFFEKDNAGGMLFYGEDGFTPDEDMEIEIGVYVVGEGAKNDYVVISDIMLRFSETSETYEQFREQSLTITSDRPVSKWDRLECRGGVYGWVYKATQVTLDGSPDEGWNEYNDEGRKVFRYSKTNFIEQKGMFTNLFTEAKTRPFDNNQFFAMSAYYGLQNLVIRHDDSKNLNEFKDFLAENNLLFTCELQTEEFVPLPEEEQQALKELCTYYPETIIFTDSGLLLQVNYVADTQTYINNNFQQKTELEDIKKRVEDLEKVAIKQEGSDKDVRYY